jgi:TrmH family RNA methyltransferase
MITSTQNPKIKHIRQLLAERKARQEEGVFIIEGVRLVEEAVQAGIKPLQVFYSSSLNPRGLGSIQLLSQSSTPVEEVEDRIMSSLSDTENTQGILAVVPLSTGELPEAWDFILAADRIHDPGNLGTMLRSAAAAGVQAVIITPESVDPYSPKVVRAAMGAHFRLPIVKMDWPDIGDVCREKRSSPAAVLVASPAGGRPCWQTDLRQPLVLVIGSEAEGPQPAAFATASGTLHIPMPGKAESLNAAVAASILLYEVVRQRNS